MTFLRWVGCSFYVKNKLKSEIFNEKNIGKQKCFFLSQLRIQTENSLKNPVFRGGGRGGRGGGGGGWGGELIP